MLSGSKPEEFGVEQKSPRVDQLQYAVNVCLRLLPEAHGNSVFLRSRVCSDGECSSISRISSEWFAASLLVDRVFLPKTIEEIGVSSFSGSAAKLIVSEANWILRAIEDRAFSHSAVRHCVLPKHLSAIDSPALPFIPITVDRENVHFSNDAQNAYDKGQKVLVPNFHKGPHTRFPSMGISQSLSLNGDRICKKWGILLSRCQQFTQFPFHKVCL
jgi:hypothetical protein